MSRRALGVGLLILVAVNTWLGAARIALGLAERRAEWDLAQARLDSAWRRLEWARFWAPGFAPVYTMSARVLNQAQANGLRLDAFPERSGQSGLAVTMPLLARAIDLSPTDAWAWFTLAEAIRAEQASQDRLARLRAAVERPQGPPPVPPPGLRAGDGLLLAATRQAQRLEPGWYFYSDFLARLLDQRGLEQAAAVELQRGYALMPRPSVHDILGDEILRRYPAALEAGLAQAQAEGALDAISLAWGRAETLEFLGEDDAAVAAWSELATMVDRESRPQCHYAVARILVRAGRLEDSLPVLRKLVDDYPGDRLEAGALSLLAQSQSKLGRHEAALESLRQALGVSDRPGAVLVLMARESEAMGEPDEAERLYRAALARDPDWFPAVRSLSLYLAGRGRDSEAVEIAERYSRRHPGDSTATRLLESIAEPPGS